MDNKGFFIINLYLRDYVNTTELYFRIKLQNFWNTAETIINNNKYSMRVITNGIFIEIREVNTLINL